jgi:hypothetical protein
MAKKQKRNISSGTGSSSTSFMPAAFTPAAPRATYVQEFNPDYSHVTRDLKQIGMLTGIFVATLAVLSFILR